MIEGLTVGTTFGTTVGTKDGSTDATSSRSDSGAEIAAVAAAAVEHTLPASSGGSASGAPPPSAALPTPTSAQTPLQAPHQVEIEVQNAPGADAGSTLALRSAASRRLIEARERSVCNGINPWLAPLAMLLTQDLALPAFFGRIRVQGREHLPRQGPVLLAPTHRARWDALLLPLVAGERISGRHCRFMVTRDEMKGLQGWFLHRLGCFPIDQGRPTLASLRLAVNLLERGDQLVVFPEGRIHRLDEPLRLQQGLARLAQLARSQGVEVRVVPVGIAYGRPVPLPGDVAAVQIGEPLAPVGEGRESARQFTEQLAAAMAEAERSARQLVGRPQA